MTRRISTGDSGSPLDLRVPPVAVLAIAALLGWGLARLFPGLDFRLPGAGWLAGAIAVTGGIIAVAGVAAFRQYGTTVDPRLPAEASTVVTAGIYRYTRNPMYVGLVLLLTAGALALENLAAFAVVPLFIAWITAFQIRPEERLLLEKFGTPYAEYAMKVRRWI